MTASAAEHIRDARMRRGLSQRELAAVVGTSQSTIARYESGTVVPGFDTLARILDALDHRILVLPEPDSDTGDVALARWFLTLGIEDRIDAWEHWLHLVDEATDRPKDRATLPVLRATLEARDADPD